MGIIKTSQARISMLDLKEITTNPSSSKCCIDEEDLYTLICLSSKKSDLPLASEIFSRIVLFLSHSSDYVNVMCICKRIYLAVTREYVRCSKNIEFTPDLKLFSKQTVKDFVYKLRLKDYRPKRLEMSVKNEEGVVRKTNSIFTFFPHITSLKVEGKSIIGREEFTSYSLFSKIKELSFVHNTKVDDFLVSDFTNVYSLSLSKCNTIYGMEITDLNKVKYLSLRSCPYATDVILKKFPNLEHLVIGDCPRIYLTQIMNARDKFQGKTVPFKLKSIKIDGSDEISDTALKEFSTLEKIDLIDCTKFQGNGVSKFKNLKEISISGSTPVSDDAFEGMKKIENLSLFFCESLTGMGFNYLENLKTLKLESIETMKDGVLSQLKYLEKLTIWDCPNLVGREIGKLSNLRELVIGQNNVINGNFYAGANKLEYLTVHNCHKFFINCPFEDLQKLRFLEVRQCDSICYDVVARFSSLHTFFVSDCKNMYKYKLSELPPLKKITFNHFYLKNSFWNMAKKREEEFEGEGEEGEGENKNKNEEEKK